MPLLRAPGVLQLPSARHTQPVLQEPYARYCDLDEWRLFARPILQGASKPNPLAESSASPTSETPTEGDGGGWSGNGIARRARVKGHLRKGHLRWRTRRIGWQAARHVFVRTESAVQSVQILVAPLTDTESAQILEFRISKHAWDSLLLRMNLHSLRPLNAAQRSRHCVELAPSACCMLVTLAPLGVL